MTLTSISIEICTDCLLIVANDDDSGIEDPAAHRAAMEEHAALRQVGAAAVAPLAAEPRLAVPGDQREPEVGGTGTPRGGSSRAERRSGAFDGLGLGPTLGPRLQTPQNGVLGLG